jgi:hypothetical protein
LYKEIIGGKVLKDETIMVFVKDDHLSFRKEGK